MFDEAEMRDMSQTTGPAPADTPRRRVPAGAHVAVRGLGHSYRRADGPVLEAMDFEIQPGEVVALLGRSGCGKSTLLHMLSGLSQPALGEVVINGNTVQGPSPRWVMMFQAPSLYPWMTVAQNVALGLRFTGRSGQIATRVPEVLDLVDLSAFADRNAQELSGGQQQRVALARSLAPRPEVLLLDEPFSALDAFTRRNLQQDVRQIARGLGLTLVLVTHDVAEAVRMADRVLVLRANPGRIAEDVTIELDEPARQGTCEAFQRAHDRLMGLYSRVADIDTAAAPQTI
ncbi:ABC transporter ATP-binding protein [Rhodovulum marinum]|uniref:NitT/TauT family transport system ATP-binding protein n=1 Tax=Rhodovulum marinum TaxID=320662 RepID=A0A4R2PXW0_9RHOB|nr:ABC transporter ATP-binding protein [Rhodovulum marinum]TCP39998.1 NitT/TauT family transport system ATP-binding protein [Rhodovulum marinum]